MMAKSEILELINSPYAPSKRELFSIWLHDQIVNRIRLEMTDFANKNVTTGIFRMQDELPSLRYSNYEEQKQTIDQIQAEERWNSYLKDGGAGNSHIF